MSMEQQPLTAEQWEQAARFLFDLLDDIDTASDMAKSNDAAYRDLVGRIHHRRFEVAETDGYRVAFRPLEQTADRARSGEG